MRNPVSPGIPGKSRLPARVLILLLAFVALCVGWREFWFLCDDAYIAFRYVSNAQAGFGYVWNPPPWKPVEGYTSLAWVMLLDGVWRLSGIMPPKSAPLLSLGFSAVSVGLVAWMALRLPLRSALSRHRTAVLAAVLFATLSNRAFLAWTSSGLETALFSSIMLAWVAAAVVAEATPLVLLSTLAAAMAITRPDGLLFVVATAAFIAVRARPLGRRAVMAASPLLLPAIHIAWRMKTYGYPLPNSYYAKHLGPWPLAGIGYLTSFLLEYAYWIWLGVAIVAAVTALRGLRRVGVASALGGLTPGRMGAWIGVAAVVGHFAYYTFDIGGDHFEYRVYHHLIPLLALSFFALCDRMEWPSRRTWITFALMTSLGLALPWTHWWHTRTAVGHKEKGSFIYPIAKHIPLPLRPYAMAWDALQKPLLKHFIGIRHQGHRTYGWYQYSRYPTRAEGEQIPLDGFPVLSASAVGYPAWSMPNVAIIDWLGLNDIVAARTPSRHTSQAKRKMAHDRAAPMGYVMCFRPNVTVDPEGKATVNPRAVPLTADEIRECESTWLEKVTGGDLGD